MRRAVLAMLLTLRSSMSLVCKVRTGAVPCPARTPKTRRCAPSKRFLPHGLSCMAHTHPSTSTSTDASLPFPSCQLNFHACDHLDWQTRRAPHLLSTCLALGDFIFDICYLITGSPRMSKAYKPTLLPLKSPICDSCSPGLQPASPTSVDSHPLGLAPIFLSPHEVLSRGSIRCLLGLLARCGHAGPICLQSCQTAGCPPWCQVALPQHMAAGWQR